VVPMSDPCADSVAASVRSRSMARPVTVAAALLLAGALAGCGSSHSTQPAAAPSQVANVDDSSVSIVTPPPTTAPSAEASNRSSTGATAQQGATAAPVPATGKTSTSTGGSTTSRTVPGVADGATALPSTATVADNGRCSVSMLRLEPLDLQGSPGGTYANFRLVNVSGKTCAVRGYVGATLVGDAGNAMATSVRHEAGQDVWVKVASKGSAQFHLRFANPMAGPTPCNPPNAAKVRVSVPGQSGTLTSATPEGGIQACNGQLSTAPIGST
jgi:hypothetical protein